MPEDKADDIKDAPMSVEIATLQKDPDYFYGYLNVLDNPDTTLQNQSTGEGLRLYDDVKRDWHAGAVLQIRYLAVVGCEREFLPADDTPEAAEIAKFVETALNRINLDQAMQELLQGILYGFYALEVMWESKDGKWLPKKLRAKHPNRFVFDLDRNPRLVTWNSLLEGEELPERKFVIFSYGSSDNPYGEGLGQRLWWPVWFKKNGIKFWLIFLEKFGMPTPVGKYPPGTSKEAQQALLDAIDAIHTETGVKIPNTMAIELLEAARQGTVSHRDLCDYMDAGMSKTILSSTLTTEVGQTGGAYAASQTHDEVRGDILKADADVLCECLNESIIKWIVDFNFVTDKYPKMWLRTEEEGDLKPLAERDKILTRDIGVTVPKRYFHDTYNLPEPEKDEETIGGIVSEPSPAPPSFAEDEGGTQEIEADAARKGQPSIEKMLAPVMAAIKNATSLEEIGEKLYRLYPDMDSKEFQDLLAKAIFASAALGAAEEQDESGKQWISEI